MAEQQLISQTREYFSTGVTQTLSWRLTQLAALQNMLLENEDAWVHALEKDLGKSEFESWVTEISQVIAEIKHLRSNLPRWMGDKNARTPLALAPASSRIRRDPLGVVVIIAPWNYPLQLMLSPLAGAIAGGNTAIIKPSEISTAIEQLTAELVPQYLDRRAFSVVTGGAETSNELIDQAPDHVFFTGSTQVGSIIAQRCAKQLIPFTLELGGKSPAYVHSDASIKVAARRLVWAKFLNAGQTCVAPDHIYVHHSIADRLTGAITQEIIKQFGKNPKNSKDYGRIITSRHTERFQKMLAGIQPHTGGEVDVEHRYVAPTIIYPAEENDSVMAEEIFGPILPILPVGSPDEAIQRISTRDKPLAFYIFAQSKTVQQRLLTKVQSGGAAINAAVIHLSTPYLPFGGVGESGQGNYHGRWSFDTFTHERAVMAKPTFPDTLAMITAPISQGARWLVKNVLMTAGKPPAKHTQKARKINRER